MVDIQLSINSYPLPETGVVSRLVGDEAVLVQPEQGKVKVLNEVGARIWTLADGSRTIQQIAELLSGEYQVDAAQAQSDTLEFIGELVERGLMGITDQPEKQIG